MKKFLRYGIPAIIADSFRGCETAFLSAVSQRTEETAARQVGIVKEIRQTADNAYRSLVELVNALTVVNGEAPYATFIDHVNAIIDRQKTVLKARQTNAKKKGGSLFGREDFDR